MLGYRRVAPSIKFGGAHLCTCLEWGTVRVKCLAQEHNTMLPARVGTQTARSGDEGTSHETAALPEDSGKEREKTEALVIDANKF